MVLMNHLFNSEDFYNKLNVSRETLSFFSKWEEGLKNWNQKTNLVSKKSLSEFWLRHAFDSTQLINFFPKHAKLIVDFGSGAGFPALALSILTREEKHPSYILVESRKKKIIFLESIIKTLNLKNVYPIAERIENIYYDSKIADIKEAVFDQYKEGNLRNKENNLRNHDFIKQKCQNAQKQKLIFKYQQKLYLNKKIDLITARACAPLDRLLYYAYPLWNNSCEALFLKGETIEQEIEMAKKNWKFTYTLIPSVSSDFAKIINIKNLKKNKWELNNRKNKL